MARRLTYAKQQAWLDNILNLVIEVEEALDAVRGSGETADDLLDCAVRDTEELLRTRPPGQVMRVRSLLRQLRKASSTLCDVRLALSDMNDDATEVAAQLSTAARLGHV